MDDTLVAFVGPGFNKAKDKDEHYVLAYLDIWMLKEITDPLPGTYLPIAFMPDLTALEVEGDEDAD